MSEMIYLNHGQLSNDLLDEIIKIKTIVWPYSYESQYSWIKSNLKDTDVHVLLSIDKKIVAYLNLIEIKLKVNNKCHSGYGIGNVCAAERGKGWGKDIIKHVNLYLIDTTKIGLLFCKDELVKFYSENNWELISKKKLFLPLIDNVQTMVYNYHDDLRRLEYTGKPF
jgi:hypothetical protein